MGLKINIKQQFSGEGELGLKCLYIIEKEAKSNDNNFTNSNFTNNLAHNYGGAIASSHSHVNNCLFENNEANHGGAIFSLSFDIKKSTFKNNVGVQGNETIVVFCFDCDEYDRRPEDLKFLQDAEEYCKKHGYKFVWFCKDVESVYIGKTVPDNQKVKVAGDFKKKQLIKQVDMRNLRADQYLNQKSNICNVLDEIFNE